MPKGFDAVDDQHRDVETVARKQLGVVLDVNLLQFVQLGTVGLRHLLLHHFTKVTTGFCVKSYLLSHVHCCGGRMLLRKADEASALPAPELPLANSVVIDV